MDHCLAIYHDFEIGRHFSISVFHLAKLGWMAWRNALPLTRLTAASPSTPASPRIFKSPWTSSTTWSVPLPSESMISNLAFFGQDFQPFRSNSEKEFGNSTVAEKWQVGSVPWEFQIIHQSLSKSSMLPIMSYPILGESWNSIHKQCWTWKLVTHRKWTFWTSTWTLRSWMTSKNNSFVIAMFSWSWENCNWKHGYK